MRKTVGEAVRKALYDRRFRSGEPLHEAELAAEMGVSRGPVREALLGLVQEGLLTHSPNRGFAVVEFTEEDFRETNEVRLPLESIALTLARPRILKSHLLQLSEMKREIVKSYVADNPVSCCQSDMSFHGLIWDFTGNVKLASTLRTLLAPFFAYGSLFTFRRPELTAELLEEEHQCFIDFLTGSKERTAEECVRFHLGIPPFTNK
jgi:DNA-binding GntR family transcriptional regulator